MKLRLISTLTLATALTALPIAHAADSANAYPDRPITVVAPYGPGTAVDIPARIISQALGPELGQSVIVLNRSGAGGTIGAELAKTSKPDGYTLLFLSPGLAVSQSLYPKLSYNLGKDFSPITMIGSSPNVLIVNQSSDVKSLQDFIAHAKANPGKLEFGSTGNGSSPHLTAEMFNQQAGTQTVHVPYKNFGDGMSDLLAGRIQYMFATLPSALSFVKAGQVRVLAVTSAERNAALPDVPSIAEALPGYEMSGWFGFAAPLGTPKPIIDKLHASLIKVLSEQDVRRKLQEQGITVSTNTPEAFNALINSEIEKWAEVIKATKMRVD